MAVLQQPPSIILPRVWSTGLETENIADLLAHNSIEFATNYIRDKIVHITATEAVAAGVPGPLWAWIETSPYPTAISGAYWGAIGGGGGAQAAGVPVIPPVVPVIEVAAGVNLRVHGFSLVWAGHSPYARLVLWTPVAAALPLALWVVQATVSAKG